jgi:uncharacterized protein YjgD (DUF1641 family)
MKAGLKQEHLDRLQDKVTRDVVERLLQSSNKRLGLYGGIAEILKH